MFTLADLISEVQRLDPSRERTSIQPVVQGMTVNAGKGPPSPCGRPLIRVHHGVYSVREPGTIEAPAPVRRADDMARSPRGDRGSTAGRDAEVSARVHGVVSEFGECVLTYDRTVPFARSGQYELHRQTIDRRRGHASVRDAVDDDAFVQSLHQTLQAWGIGRRASRLLPQAEFAAALRARADTVASFELVRIDDPDLDAAEVATGLWEVIETLRIVANASLIVPGSKTLHHLLPDLVPPMDRAWTGAFFRWSAAAPQSGQRRTFIRTFTRFAEIARHTSPADYVGPGWRTSTSKILDNAIIGYCKTHASTVSSPQRPRPT